MQRTLVSLARMKMSTRNHIRNQDLVYVIQRYMTVWSDEDISRIIWSAGRMNLNYKEDIPDFLQENILERLTQVAVSLQPNDLCALLCGMAELGMTWGNIPTRLQSSIDAAVCRASISISIPNIADVTSVTAAATTSPSPFIPPPHSLSAVLIYILGKLGVNKNAVSDRMQISIELILRKIGVHMSVVDLIRVLQGLYKMGYSWDTLMTRTKETLETAVFNQGIYWAAEGHASAHYVGEVMEALRKLQCKWKDVSAPMRAGVLVGIRALGDFNGKKELNVHAMHGEIQIFLYLCAVACLLRCQCRIPLTA